MSETPLETPAPARGGRRAVTLLGLVGALIGTLGILAFLIVVVVRPDAGGPPRTDWHTTAAAVSAELGIAVVDPELPEGWTANFARTETVDEVLTWRIGFLTPDDKYLELRQAFLGEESKQWIADHSVDALQVQFLVGSVVILSGTAGEAELVVLQTAIASEQLGAP